MQHQLKDLLAQRLYGLVQGYEDLNDHDRLREDPTFGIAVGKLESRHERCAAAIATELDAIVPAQV